MPKIIREDEEGGFKHNEYKFDPDWFDDRPFTQLPEDETFSIGYDLDIHAAVTLVCKMCGGTEFNVGQGGFFTAIKCPKCGWEEGIHEG